MSALIRITISIAAAIIVTALTLNTEEHKKNGTTEKK